MRKELEALYKNRFPSTFFNLLSAGDNLFINSRVMVDDDFIHHCNELSENTGLFHNDDCLAFRKNIHKDTVISVEGVDSLTANLQHIEVDNAPFEHIWELVHLNQDQQMRDYIRLVQKRKNQIKVQLPIGKATGVHLLNPDSIFIGEDVIIEPNVVINAQEGPVFLDNKSVVMANAVIKGPAYIGENSIVRVGAKIYPGTTIGKVCKVGGEIEESIIQAYSNKQHEGFLGHSYIGEWVNIGAGTNNSDLKNNYNPVKVYFYPDDKVVDTGMQFFGIIIGDHSKTGINTMFNTGCVVGIGCNLYGTGFFSGFVPSFSWGTADSQVEYKIEKFIETAKVVKSRRNLDLSPQEIALLKSCFQGSSSLREKYNKSSINE
jgi:UDP-N-acetylglucosamine diphosphorylase/glucosamine-1-phosphate N-acetyltransferase